MDKVMLNGVLMEMVDVETLLTPICGCGCEDDDWALEQIAGVVEGGEYLLSTDDEGYIGWVTSLGHPVLYTRTGKVIQADGSEAVAEPCTV